MYIKNTWVLRVGEGDCLSSDTHICTGYTKGLCDPHSLSTGGRRRPRATWCFHRFRVQLDPRRGSTPQVHVCQTQAWFTSAFTVHSQRSRGLQRKGHCSMMSLRFSCRMVSLTAWKTKRMFSVSTAVVKWWNSGFPRFLLLRLKDCTRKAWKEQSGGGRLSNWVKVSSPQGNGTNTRGPVSVIGDFSWRKHTWPNLWRTGFLIDVDMDTLQPHIQSIYFHNMQVWKSVSSITLS